MRAPRPEVPWVPQKFYDLEGNEISRSASKGSRTGSKRTGSKRKSSKRKSSKRTASKEPSAFGDVPPEDELSDEEFEDDGMISRRGACFTKRVLPATIFVLGALFWIRFWMYYVETSQRNNGKCYITDFMKGKDCRDCFFAVNVNGMETTAMDQVTFERNDDGEVVAESPAYQCCGKGKNSQAPNCCEFQTGDDSANPKFCDLIPKENGCKFDDGNWLTSDPVKRDAWACNFLVGENGNPHDIQYGDTTWTQWVWLYLSLLFLGILFPTALWYNAGLNKKFLRELEDTVESSRAYQEQKEMEHDAERKAEIAAKMKAAQRNQAV